ncbi:MAG TPA: hypothetical protein VM802_17320 [Chitinophaga sp.]|uniref:hypothetical protein n=1 Tax=Chitinophaga sp. TaxID=1869181 RepID=UPI002CCD0358|nr:hypothetical protein [Chitinophaga sp.]HVI46642.1 hypothetical protein [Chitinophaga sp.]
MAIGKKQKVIILISVILVALAGFLYYFGFALVLRLFTPGDGQLRPQEQAFLDSLRTAYNCQGISRDPKYFMNDTSRKAEYALSFTFKQSPAGVTSDNVKDSLKQEAFNIARHSYLYIMKKSPKFTSYGISFYYEDAVKDYSFDFKPEELESANGH